MGRSIFTAGLCTFATVAAVYFAFILTALLMPADIVSQAIFAPLIFFPVSAVLTFWVVKAIGVKREPQGGHFNGSVMWSTVALNFGLFLAGAALIYSGFVTPLEASVLCLGALFFGLLALFHKCWS